MSATDLSTEIVRSSFTANDIPYKIVEGNNVLEVTDATKELIHDARTGGGPRCLEAFTYRWYGHVDWREDIDVGVCRSREDVDNWRAKDPIKRLVEGMCKSNLMTHEDFNSIETSLSLEVDKAWDQAMSDPYPDTAEILNRVYK